MKNAPVVTVVITNYNYGAYISEAIESILNQSYSNIELIIINDGSTDNSDQVITSIIKKNTNRNIKYVSRDNKGIVYTRNEGLKLARGEYLSYLDADDFFDKDYIAKCYKIASEYNVDVVYPNWHFVGEWLGRPDTDFPEFTPELLQLQKLHVTPASLIRKKSIGNRKFEVETVAEDWDFFIGMSLDGARFKLAKNCTINYRIRKGTRGSKNDPREDTRYFVEILEKHRKEHPDEVIDPKRLVSIRHPSILLRLANKHPASKALARSIREQGAVATSKKVAAKIVARSNRLRKMIWYIRDKKYRRILGSFEIHSSSGAKLAVVLHLYYVDSWPMLKKKLANISTPFDLFVTVQEKDKDIKLDRINTFHGKTNILALPNRGRDVLPFLLMVQKISEAGQYSHILKLHSKKSPHREDGEEWINSLLDQLIPKDTSNIVRTLEKQDTGAIGPADHVVSLRKYMGGNRDQFAMLLEKITNKDTLDNILLNQENYPFFGGTMFWCRVDFLSPLLLGKNVSAKDFNTEKGQVDKTTAHAMERVFGKTLHEITGKRMYTISKNKIKELPSKSYTSEYKYVE